MKKTLVALAVAAFAASASAVTVYENEGTKVDFDGQLRLLLEEQATKEKGQSSTRGHTNLKNNSSRFGISIKHNINENLYGFGRYETRLGRNSKNDAGWGDVTTEKAYVGLGGYGHEISFGKQAVIGDSIGQAGFDKVYGVGTGGIKYSANNTNKKGFDILTDSSDSAINYTYTGIEGLTLGANYNVANERNNKGEVKVDSAKSGFGLGAEYTAKIAESQSVTVAAGYTHDDYKSGSSGSVSFNKKDKDGVYFGLKYVNAPFTVAVDGGHGVLKTDNVKEKIDFVRTGARFDVTPKSGVYGNYSYGTYKDKAYKATAHQFMLGADYKLHKQVVTFVEGRLIKNKDSNNKKVTDQALGVGLRVLW
ncbi:porin [Glaesserella parasuis]|uniref:porin n=1 Tax=Glaesserella parasuis TaxID=738 RepID=UPI002436889E|nr:porin [Glaesserella parasuis]MDG6236566.1 porin [Glaesserella parasuis]MDG6362738.1 porin [Glaesserella parasuis]MDG6827391.1 porin [Glaesserella parasuis]MDO9647840.1 porin [Glaesserella parasuis]MDO9961873.1 porin [Glaesserella parasuis]